MDNIKKAAKNFKREVLLLAAAMIVSGLLFIIFPESSVSIICYIIGVALVLWGVMRLVGYFNETAEIFGSFGLMQGLALMIGGIVIIARPQIISGMITTVFGIALIVDALLKLQYAFDLFKIKAKHWYIVLALAAVMAILGLLVIFNPFKAASVLAVFAGISLVCDGISDIASVLYISSVIKDVKSDLGAVDDFLKKDKEE